MILLRLLGYAWAAPVSLVGLLLAVIYWPRSVRWHDGAFELVAHRRLVPRFAVAQTFGWLIWISPAFVGASPQMVALIATHERRHVHQCLILGPFTLLTYPLASLIAWLRGGHFYRDNWFELDARRAERNLHA